MKKHLFALLCALALLVSTVPAAALEGETLRAADTLAALGMIDSADTVEGYNLNGSATRAQAALLLVRLSGSVKDAAGARSAGFRDTPAWARNEINYAAQQGWASGVSATEFKPDSTITANAWFAMLLRMLGYSDKAGDFTVDDAAAFARRIGLTPNRYEDTMTRGDVFTSMRDALSFSYKDGSSTVAQRLVAKKAVSRAAANALGLMNPELTARQAADRHMAAVFGMELYTSEEEIRQNASPSSASGFFISPDGLAVTNYHSIDGSIHAVAVLSTGESYEVSEVVYYDKNIDIAVIRVSRTSLSGNTTSAFACLELAGTADIRSGDPVYSLGNPLGLGLAVSAGLISDTARDVERYSLPCVMNTADISQGSSGGALLNVYGKVIAVTSGAYTNGNNMYLAVPVDPVMSADLTATGKTLAQVAKLEAVGG